MPFSPHPNVKKGPRGVDQPENIPAQWQGVFPASPTSRNKKLRKCPRYTRNSSRPARCPPSSRNTGAPKPGKHARPCLVTHPQPMWPTGPAIPALPHHRRPSQHNARFGAQTRGGRIAGYLCANGWVASNHRRDILGLQIAANGVSTRQSHRFALTGNYSSRPPCGLQRSDDRQGKLPPAHCQPARARSAASAFPFLPGSAVWRFRLRHGARTAPSRATIQTHQESAANPQLPPTDQNFTRPPHGATPGKARQPVPSCVASSRRQPAHRASRSVITSRDATATRESRWTSPGAHQLMTAECRSIDRRPSLKLPKTPGKSVRCRSGWARNIFEQGPAKSPISKSPPVIEAPMRLARRFRCPAPSHPPMLDPVARAHRPARWIEWTMTHRNRGSQLRSCREHSGPRRCQA